MKIAMLGHKRIPTREGGCEVVVEELSTRMVQKGHQVTCYNRKGHHVSGKAFDGENVKEYKGIRIKTVSTINKKGLAALISSIFASIKASFGNYDIIHFHAEGSCAMLWLPKMMKKQCITTVHGLDHQRVKWGKMSQAYILFGEKVAVKYADEIIVLSRNVQDYFLKTYGRETRFIPNGVNKPVIRNVNLIRSQFGLEQDKYILFLGRIVPEKGLKYLIQAFKQINTSKKLVIAGGASDTEDFTKEIQEMAKHDNRIIFTGFVQGELLDELYSNAYIYTLPSDLEGMPLSLLEAMSYGNCCLVSDIPECTSVVENNGIVFEAGNTDDLRNKLQVLCDNEKQVDECKKNSAEFICEKYNWDDIVDDTLKLYERVGV